MSAPVIPDKVEPELPYRVWDVGSYAGQSRLLVSCNGEAWPQGLPLRARCTGMRFLPITPLHSAVRVDPPKHRSPSPGCSCGVYAAELHEAVGYWDNRRIFGKAALWGTVIPGSKGFRAEYAYPAELYITDDWLAEHYVWAYASWEQIRGVRNHHGLDHGPRWKPAVPAVLLEQIAAAYRVPALPMPAEIETALAREFTNRLREALDIETHRHVSYVADLNRMYRQP